VAIMLSAFVFPRSLVEAQEEQIRQTPNNRVVTRPKIGWSGTIPASYADVIRELPGVKHACGGLWAGFKVPGKDNVFFEGLGMQAEPFVAMHYEVEAPQAQKQAFLEDDRGALVSAELAKEFGWKLGDRVVLESRNLPGKWEVNVSSIFQSTRDGFGRRAVWIHWAYLNRSLPVEMQDKLGFVSAEIYEPNQGGRIATEIDNRFESAPFQTLSLEDKVLAAANIGRFRAVLTALDVVSYSILAIVMSIVGNTLAMNVRERTQEYGVMRAIGFGPRQLTFLVLGEAALIGLLGGLMGLAISYPLIERGVSRALQESLNFPPVVIPTQVAWLSLLLGVALSVLAAAVPVYRLAQLRVTEALRRVG
jgi:putative ABC transport system permease protein